MKFTKARVKGHKRDITFPNFGYKNHVTIDKRRGFIRNYTTKPASAYDGAQLEHVLKRFNRGSKVQADTAYRTKDNEEWLKDYGYFSDIHNKKSKGKLLSKAT